MNHNFKNKIGLSRAPRVISTLVVLLLMMSAQGVVEECAQETGSSEVELVLVRHELHHRSENDVVRDRDDPDSRKPVIATPSVNSFFAFSTERSMMNGIGTYLLI